MASVKRVSGYKKVCFILCICMFGILFMEQMEQKDNNIVMSIDSVAVENGEYALRRNGIEQQFFEVEDGEKVDVKIEVQQMKGKLKISIFKIGEEDKPIYEGNEFPDRGFVVSAKDKGEYGILIEAQEFIGNYSIKC